MKYLKKFELINDYIIWKNSDNYISPNVSMIDNDDEDDIINYNPLIIINPSVTINDWTYGETASNPVISGNTGNGTVTYLYKVSSADDSTYTSTKPTDAGTYTIKANINTIRDYSAGSCTSAFTIYKGNLSASVSIEDWYKNENPAIPVITGNVENGTVTYLYKVTGADDSTYSSEIPTEIGSYTIKATIESTSNYNGISVTGIFYIKNHVNGLTIESLEDNNTISWKASNSSLTKTILVSTDNGSTWTSKTSSTSGVTLAILNKGDKLLIKGNNSTYGNNSYNYFSSTGEFNVEGNIMSLINGDNFENQTTLSSQYTFENLFYHCTKLKSAEHLVLPATTLAKYCYNEMFAGCTSLTTAPQLPATTLAEFCYLNMFADCTSLTTAPKLPATTLTYCCYQNMFNDCTSLTTAPELPATTLADWCYTGMFEDCTSLTTAPELPATKLTGYCYTSMFSGCTSLTTAPELPATTLVSYCYASMFSGCTSLTTAPELPATTLVSYCYSGMFQGCTALMTAPNILPATTLAKYCYDGMFQGCTSLTTAPELPATTLAEQCYHEMFKGCTALTTSPALPATTLASKCYQSMFQGCTALMTAPNILPATTLADHCYDGMFLGCRSLTTAPELPATTLAQYCYNGMFNGCSALTVAPELLPATTLAYNCYNGMFNGCSALTTAPELPATTLVSYCYSGMFNGCTSLNYIKCLATNISASSCTYYWLYGVASIGTFVKADNMGSWTTGSNGIPVGWTIINNGDVPIVWNNNDKYLVSSSDKPTLINPFNVSVTYSSSDTNVATIDSNGAVTFITPGTTTLTAVFEGNEQYEAKTATCTLIISEPITLCTLYNSSNSVLAQIEGTSTALTQSLVSSYKSSTYKVIISSNCTSIGTDTFKQFTNLRSITISSNVSTIGNNAFTSCSSLKEIICNRTTAPSLGSNNVFADIARGGVLITPSGSSGYNTWMSTSYFYLGYYQWYNAVGTFGDTEPTLQWSSSSYTITSDYFSTPTLSKSSGISVTYRSSNTSVATINSSGTVSKGSNGITYIQAIFAGNSTYKPKVAMYTLTVNIYTGGSSGGGGGGE